MVVLVPHGELAKILPVVRLATHKLIESVDTVVGVEILATTLSGKHMTTAVPLQYHCTTRKYIFHSEASLARHRLALLYVT